MVNRGSRLHRVLPADHAHLGAMRLPVPIRPFGTVRYRQEQIQSHPLELPKRHETPLHDTSHRPLVCRHRNRSHKDGGSPRGDICRSLGHPNRPHCHFPRHDLLCLSAPEEGKAFLGTDVPLLDVLVTHCHSPVPHRDPLHSVTW